MEYLLSLGYFFEDIRQDFCKSKQNIFAACIFQIVVALLFIFVVFAFQLFINPEKFKHRPAKS